RTPADHAIKLAWTSAARAPRKLLDCAAMANDEDDFAAMFAESEKKPKRKDPQVGDEVRGRVVSIGRDAVFLDLGTKSDGMIELVELRDADGKVTVKVGDELEARVVETGDRSGVIVLRRAFGRGGAAGSEE